MRTIPKFTDKELEKTKRAIRGESAKIYRDTNGKVDLVFPEGKEFEKLIKDSLFHSFSLLDDELEGHSIDDFKGEKYELFLFDDPSLVDRNRLITHYTAKTMLEKLGLKPVFGYNSGDGFWKVPLIDESMDILFNLSVLHSDKDRDEVMELLKKKARIEKEINKVLERKNVSKTDIEEHIEANEYDLKMA